MHVSNAERKVNEQHKKWISFECVDSVRLRACLLTRRLGDILWWNFRPTYRLSKGVNDIDARLVFDESIQRHSWTYVFIVHKISFSCFRFFRTKCDSFAGRPPATQWLVDRLCDTTLSQARFHVCLQRPKNASLQRGRWPYEDGWITER